jgi:hypothetical protein
MRASDCGAPLGRAHWRWRADARASTGQRLGRCMRVCVWQLAQKERQLAEKERQLAEKEMQLAEQNKLLAEKDRQLAEKDRLLADQGRQLADQAGQLADQARQLAEKDARIEQLEQAATRPVCVPVSSQASAAY